MVTHFQNLAKSDLNYILDMILEDSILKAFFCLFFWYLKWPYHGFCVFYVVNCLIEMLRYNSLQLCSPLRCIKAYAFLSFLHAKG